MPVNETIDLQRNLQRELGMPLDRIFMNGIYPELFTDEEAVVLREHAERRTATAPTRSRRAAARGPARGRVGAPPGDRAPRAARAPRATEAGQEPVELPFLFRPQLDMDAVEDLADDVEEQLDR